MKLSDFYLGSRHLFAYVAPGALWICGGLLIAGKNPVEVVGEAPWGLHLIFFIAGSFVLGFVLQTLVFRALEKLAPYPVLGKAGDNHPAESLANRLHQKLCTDFDLAKLDRERIPKFCRNLALEYGSYSRHRILEFENEINFMVALAFSLPVVSFGWIIHLGWKEALAWPPLLLTLLYLRFTWKRIPEMRRHETVMWCEKYLILRARNRLGGGIDA